MVDSRLHEQLTKFIHRNIANKIECILFQRLSYIILIDVANNWFKQELEFYHRHSAPFWANPGQKNSSLPTSKNNQLWYYVFLKVSDQYYTVPWFYMYLNG